MQKKKNYLNSSVSENTDKLLSCDSITCQNERLVVYKFVSFDILFMCLLYKILAPHMWATPKKVGELKKKGALRHSWKKRWFILQDTNLFYFKSKTVRKQRINNIGNN